MAGGRSIYTEKLVATVLARIADGESLRSICSEEGMPDKATFLRWLASKEGLQDRYALAREFQADAIFDEILDIADDGRNDWIEKRNSDGEVIGWQENGEALRRSHLRVDARKWMAGKLRPKKYGDKLDVEHSGAVAVSFNTVYEAKPEEVK